MAKELLHQTLLEHHKLYLLPDGCGGYYHHHQWQQSLWGNVEILNHLPAHMRKLEWLWEICIFTCAVANIIGKGDLLKQQDKVWRILHLLGSHDGKQQKLMMISTL